MRKTPRLRRLAESAARFCLVFSFLAAESSGFHTIGNNASIQSREETPQRASPQVGPDPGQQLSFRVVRISNGVADDKKTWWEAFSVLASNGQKLWVSNTPFPSVDRSDKQFQLWVKSAEKILRRAPELNEKGKLVGERVLRIFSVKSGRPPDSAPEYSVIWTSGANLWRLSGEHLEDVLSLENRLKVDGTGALWKWALAEQSIRN
jgi:hypothetical protein